MSLADKLASLEKLIIESSIKEHDNELNAVSKSLKITRQLLSHRMKKHKLSSVSGSK